MWKIFISFVTKLINYTVTVLFKEKAITSWFRRSIRVNLLDIGAFIILILLSTYKLIPLISHIERSFIFY